MHSLFDSFTVFSQQLPQFAHQIKVLHTFFKFPLQEEHSWGPGSRGQGPGSPREGRLERTPSFTAEWEEVRVHFPSWIARSLQFQNQPKHLKQGKRAVSLRVVKLIKSECFKVGNKNCALSREPLFSLMFDILNCQKKKNPFS